ncbi:MAG: hypothetical protein IPL72_06355 [Sulfuritalea sp.]|nr:hypothetical protein [Sulfuritalea sp.]
MNIAIEERQWRTSRIPVNHWLFREGCQSGHGSGVLGILDVKIANPTPPPKILATFSETISIAG